MPDPLDRAVDASMAAHTPDRVPPFGEVQARKQTRDRRRAGSAVAATVLAAAALAVVPSVMLAAPPTGSAPGQVAGDLVGERYAYAVRATDGRVYLADPDAPAALQRCLDLPGLSDQVALFSDPPQHEGTVSGRERADALTDCVQAVPGMDVTVTSDSEGAPAPTQQRLALTFERGTVFDEGFQGRQVRECLDLPGTSEVNADLSRPPAYSVTVTGDERINAFRRCVGKIEGAVLAEAAEARPADPGGYVPTPAQQAFIQECLSGNYRTALPVPNSVGQAETALNTLNLRGPVRVVGRDGRCLDRTDDRDDNRVNLVVDGGTVIWAGRF